MGSSHSYLLNLEATTPLHAIENGLCVEFAVPDGMTHQALNFPGIVAGPCAATEYSQFDNTYMTKSPMGNLSTGVWQIPQSSKDFVAPDWTEFNIELKENIVKAPAAMPLMNLEATTKVHVLHAGLCFEENIAHDMV